MCLPSPASPAAEARLHRGRDVHARVYDEFREMPGLTLSLPQAARLFGLDTAECRRILDALVAAGRLRTNGSVYAIASHEPVCG